MSLKKVILKYNFFINKLRILKLKFLGAKIGKNVRCTGKFYVGRAENLVIGDNTVINLDVILHCRDKIRIGKNCHLSPRVNIQTGALYIDNLNRKHYSKPVIIEDNVWLATSVIINPGVKIGKNSVVLPGSVVISDIEENSVYGGVPARLIRRLEVKNENNGN